jgi:hypothetical protein
MWGEKSKADLIRALESVELGAAALQAQLRWAEEPPGPEEVLRHLRRLWDDLAFARAAAQWEADPDAPE